MTCTLALSGRIGVQNVATLPDNLLLYYSKIRIMAIEIMRPDYRIGPLRFRVSEDDSDLVANFDDAVREVSLK
jgi:hypothetical protein